MTRLIDADALKSALEIEQYNDYDDLLRTERLIDNAPTVEQSHGEWISTKTIMALIRKVNDYYGYTESMHMFKVLFEQEHHGWVKKEGEAK